MLEDELADNLAPETRRGARDQGDRSVGAEPWSMVACRVAQMSLALGGRGPHRNPGFRVRPSRP